MLSMVTPLVSKSSNANPGLTPTLSTVLTQKKEKQERRNCDLEGKIPSVSLNHFQNGFGGIGESGHTASGVKILLEAGKMGRGTNLGHTRPWKTNINTP